ncbi:dolichyl-phosphate beta-glucosyltransferase SCDLUD_001143 [Saccharomycodes ludwigii]|uniref:dolichyl-phosphate beta-glucosyltransferase n=1 Tax=Saccharomycodes ludwigii TaxID=36035 RepID=UPI001E884B85|nr:hypothetical protein SCDLUD_001143 [Saccharomycodes ludwigii]KAH3903502.1 hypothetical protein SCDLUD_001143 [Saccharomycodes ludwigii]
MQSLITIKHYIIQNFYSLIFTLLVVVLLSVYLLVYIFSHTPRKPHEDELQCSVYDNKSHNIKSKRLKHVLNGSTETDDDASIELSVVVPSYNETGRILVMLQEAIDYLNENFKNKFEIIIVDDGSKDKTAEYCLELSKKFQDKLTNEETGENLLRVVKLVKNRGKGGAVKHGLLHIRGKYGLFADADGASNFKDVSKLLNKIKSEQEKRKRNNGNSHSNPDTGIIAIGSRAHMVNTDAVVKRSFIRNFLMYGLHTLVYIFGIRSIKDTQCGFKLFDRKAIQQVLPYLRTERWIFDVEILILALRKKIVVFEIPISWHEVGGSKVDLARDSINMAIDLVVIRLAYLLGIYKDNVEC